MTTFVEVVFETGKSTVLQVENADEALLGFIGEHYRRAIAGEVSLKNTPESPAAERIVHAYFYDRHPNDFNLSDTLTKEQLDSELPTLVERLAAELGGGIVVPVGVLAVEVRGLTHPMFTDSSVAPHDSKFRMEEIASIPIEPPESESFA